MNTIVKVTAEDDRGLYGWLVEPEVKQKSIVINIHGTSSNFYCEDFLYPVIDAVKSKSIAFLATNNRGADGLTGWEKGGSAEELFEECLLDIDAWIKFALEKGYTDIILSGHSLGTEKVVYYLNHGELRGQVKKVILFAPADSYGTEEWYTNKVSEDFLAEAKKLISEGKNDSFLSSRRCHAGELPKTAESFLNFFAPRSELSKALPFKSGSLPLYSKVNVPILAVISDNQDAEYTIIPINEALDLMKRENPNTQTVELPGTNHIFEGKEIELAKIVTDFISG